MKKIQILFKFVYNLLSEKTTDEVIQKGNQVFLRPDEETGEIILAHSFESFQNGNFVKVKISDNQVCIDHFFIKDGEVRHLEEERADNGDQPNMLSIFDEKKRKQIDSNLLCVDSQEGERERETFIDRIIHYLDRLEEYLYKESRYAKSGAA